MLNKSSATNGAALLLIGLGHFSPVFSTALTTMGMYAFSGAITNWLAIHMLFEKIPFLYGSGVIPTRFEEFKSGIFNLMMQEFFTEDNIKSFLGDDSQMLEPDHLDKIAEIIPYDDLYEQLVQAVIESPLGEMLGMFGGKKALEPVKEPFIKKMKLAIIQMSHSKTFQAELQGVIAQTLVGKDFHSKVSLIVQSRLDEMTPSMVKEVIQNMIRQHLGWLVVWGGVFGAVIGLVASAAA